MKAFRKGIQVSFREHISFDTDPVIPTWKDLPINISFLETNLRVSCFYWIYLSKPKFLCNMK